MQPPPTITQNVSLTVETAKHGNDPVVWEMSDGLKKGGPGNYPVVTVQDKAKADFTISINNPGTTTFSSDPIWIQKGQTKPTQHVIHGIKDISGGGTTVLKFTDGNKDAGKLAYVLNFDNVPAGTPKQLDPIIDNQGGGPGIYRESAINYYYVGGAVVLLALLVFILFRRRSAMPRRTEAPRPTDLNES